MYRKQTPWGTSQNHTIVADGVEFHSTVSHGGYYLSEARQSVMKSKGLPVKTWYEEDCEWAYVYQGFPELFPAAAKAHAEAILKFLE